MKPVAVVDASNVALEDKTRTGRARVETLMKMRHLLEDRGYRPIVIADAGLRHKVDDHEQYEHLVEDEVILQAPAGTQADYFVLTTAERENGVVISNDLFKDWRVEFPWIRDRRVPFMIVDNMIELHCPEVGEEHHGR